MLKEEAELHTVMLALFPAFGGLTSETVTVAEDAGHGPDAEKA
jgi:hypothetical protein